jgi:hypothetical protein
MEAAFSSETYFHVLMAPWRIIKGSGLDDCIYWQLLLQSLVITISYKNSQSIFSRTLLPWLPKTRSILVLALRLPPTELRWLLYPLGTDHAQKTQLFYSYVRVCWGSHVIATEQVHRRAGCCVATISAWSTQKTPLLYCCLLVCLNVFTYQRVFLAP